jgi:hypothetical protein
MPLIRDWLDKFLTDHRARFAVHDWPDADSDDYRDFMIDWLEAFADLQVSEEEANRASKHLTLDPPSWKRNHLPAVLKTVRAMRLERSAPSEAARDIAEAKAASVNCPHCDGGGLAYGFHPLPVPERTPKQVAAHCVCPMGRFMRNRVTIQDAPSLKHIPDFAEILAGRSTWLKDDPSGYAANVPLSGIASQPAPAPSQATSWPPPRANRPTGEPKLPDPILQRPPVGPTVSTGEGKEP